MISRTRRVSVCLLGTLYRRATGGPAWDRLSLKPVAEQAD